MLDQSWTVVRFIDEDTVEAVPSSWIVENRCYWPFKNEKIMATIRKNEQPNTCWPSYEISIFRNSTFGKHMQRWLYNCDNLYKLNKALYILFKKYINITTFKKSNTFLIDY